MLSELTWILCAAATSALLILGVTGSLGSLGFAWLLRGTNRAAAKERAIRIGCVSAGLVLLATGARLWLQCAALAESPSGWMTMLPAVLFESQLGIALRVQAGAALTFAAALTLARRTPSLGFVIAALGAVTLALSPGLGGHPAAQQARSVALLLSTLHVAGVGLWLGTLSLLWLCARRLSDEDVAGAVRRFHRLATIGLLSVVASGGAKLWMAAPSPSAIFDSPWGVALLIKLIAFVAVATLGYLHWRRADDALRRGERHRTLRSFAAELLLALLVVAATSVLVNSSPTGS